MAEKVIIEYDANIKGLTGKLDAIINKDKELGGQTEKTGKKMQDSINKTDADANNLGNSFNNLKGYVASAFAVGSILAFGKEVVDVTRKTELLQNQLNFVAGSTQAGAMLFSRLQKEAQTLGLEFTALSKGFAGFAIASKQAGISANQSIETYLKFAKGLRGAGASAQATERAFYALEQMMSKGKVSTEELRLQMGEALPGATALAARAVGKTTAEFTKMLEQGQIISSDFIPKFAAVVEKEFLPALTGKTNSLDAALIRVGNGFENLMRSIGDSNKGAFKALVDFTSNALYSFNAMAQNETMPLLQRLGVAFEFAFGGKNAKRMVEEQMEVNALNEASLQRQAEYIIVNADLSANIAAVKKEEIEDEKKASAISKLTNDELLTRVDLIQASILLFEKRNSVFIKAGTLERVVGEQAINDYKAQKFAIGLINEEISIRAGLAQKEEENRGVAAEKRKADEAIFLKNAVDLARIRVVESEGGIDRINALIELRRAEGAAEIGNIKKTATEKLLSEANLNADLKKLYADRAEMVADATTGGADEDMGLNQSGGKAIDRFLKNIGIQRDAEKKLLSDKIQGELELEAIRQRLIEQQLADTARRTQATIESVTQVANVFGGLISSFVATENQIVQQQAEQALRNQEALLQSGEINQIDYEKNIGAIKARAFEKQKEAAVIDAQIKSALAVLQLFTSLPFPAALAASPFIVALGVRQVDAIRSQPIPTFHEGGIDIGGGGNMTSGSLKPNEFLAKLERNESVITKQRTSQYYGELEAVQNGRLEDYIARHYIAPALKNARGGEGIGSSTANTIEVMFQQADLVNAVRGNKTVRLHKDTVKQLAGAMQPSSAGKILNRRAWA